MNNICFKGINISNNYENINKIALFKLTETDRPFLKTLRNKINLRELIPNIKNDEFEIYDHIIKKSLENALAKNNESLLLTCNNIPCGIIVNKFCKTKQIVEYICTWPFKKNQKLPFGAQTLFSETFNRFCNTNLNFIELYATRFGTAISKYNSLGFKSLGGDNYTELMRISREKIYETQKYLEEKINLRPATSSEDVDLTKILKFS